jgi:hypothetical protein
MPDYEFHCHACKKTFSKLLTLAEYASGANMREVYNASGFRSQKGNVS